MAKANYLNGKETVKNGVLKHEGRRKSVSKNIGPLEISKLCLKVGTETAALWCWYKFIQRKNLKQLFYKLRKGYK